VFRERASVASRAVLPKKMDVQAVGFRLYGNWTEHVLLVAPVVPGPAPLGLLALLFQGARLESQNVPSLAAGSLNLAQTLAGVVSLGTCRVVMFGAAVWALAHGPEQNPGSGHEQQIGVNFMRTSGLAVFLGHGTG
jgi:hypothetical protein